MLIRGKILQVLPELGSGGVERGTVEVTQALVAKGFEAIVASAGGVMAEDIVRAGGKHIELPLASKNPFTMWSNIHRLSDLIRREKVNLVHARSRAPAWSAYKAAQQCHVPFMTTFHGVYNGYGTGLKHRYNEIMTKGERVIAVSDFVGEHVAKEYGVEQSRIRVIHRGADVEYFDPAKVNGMRTMQLCKDWHVPEGVPIILMPGRLTRWKGQHVLIEALQQLPHRKFFCVLLGEPGKHPNYANEIKDRVEHYGLEGHVRIVGTTKHMRDAYNAASIVVSPAIEPEAFGRVPIEAQAMGKPIIATSHGGAMETVVTGETGTGWLVPPEDSKALSDTINQALNLDGASRQALAQNARQHAVENFSTQAMCDKVLEVYSELLQDHRFGQKKVA